MKKLLLISLFLIGCRKTIPTPTPDIVDIFKVNNVSVSNGQTIQFNLENAGKYTLTLYDSTTNAVVSKEKFTGVIGNNIKKIYTNTFNQKSLYLYLMDGNNQQIKQTKITIN